MKYIFWEQDNVQQISGLPKLIVMGIKAINNYSETALISQKSSLVYRTLKDEGVPFLYIEESSLENTPHINSDDVMVLPTLSPHTFVLHKYNPKVIIWQIYPSLCVTSWLQKQLIKLQLRKIISSGAYISMDKLCQETFIKETDLFPNYIIPMPIDHSGYVYCPHGIKNRIVKVSYLGRALDWKVNGLIRMLKDMETNKKTEFHLHIFTDDREKFEELIHNHISDNVKVNYYIGFHGRKMLNVIAQMDLHFAMGISTLEGASLGVPTLIAPLAYNEVPDTYSYRWIFEDIEHYAGDSLENDLKKEGWSFEHVLQQISSMASQKLISESCYQVTSSFSLSQVGKAITEVKTTLHLRDCHYRMLSYWKNRMED